MAQDSSSEEHRFKVQINEDDLLCINGCGFYGTPQCANLCSKCWRAYQVAEKKSSDFAKNKTVLTFEKYEEKRKSSTDSRSLTLRNIIKKPPSMFSSTPEEKPSSHNTITPSTSTTQHIRSLSPDSSAARSTFLSFLEQNLPTPLVQKVKKLTKTAEARMHEVTVPIDELSEMVQAFYIHIDEKLREDGFFDTSEKISSNDVVSKVESYLCKRSYNLLFCPTSDEEVADLSLQERIRSLNWVTRGFLESKLDFTKPKVCDFLDEAVAEVISMNAPRCPEEKMQHLIRASQDIFTALKRSGAPTSADEFLPGLIYVILTANPPLLQSNVKFISRFAMPDRIMKGESGYFFTNLCCALQFIQDMNHNSLKMNQKQFEAYTSGQLKPPPLVINEMSNQVLQLLEQSVKEQESTLKRGNELLKKTEAMIQSFKKCEISEDRMKKHKEWCASIEERLNKVEIARLASRKRLNDEARSSINGNLKSSTPW